MVQAFAKKKKEQVKKPELAVYCADERLGLTSSQVAERERLGYINAPVDPPGKTVKQIILSNVFTYFNIVFFILAGLIIAVRSWNDLMFMGVVLINTVIGIVQELRSKKTLDKLTLLNAPKGTVIRNGSPMQIDTEKLVRDDIVIFSGGGQIYADAVLLSGECQVNEALITGEADEVKKRPGDRLLSGSFIVSGSCTARLTAVGEESYANRLTVEARRHGKPRQSEMMRSLSNLVKWIGIIIIPFGVLMCVKEVSWLGRSFTEGVVSTVAALIGMIPEGLYLLTSLALVASILRLAQKKTLVHEMSCIETLARVDTLCVDKTGTITENKMVVDDVYLLCDDRFTSEDVRMIMRDYVSAMRDDNDTMAALRRYFTGTSGKAAVETLAFTSANKYGGVRFEEGETYLLGAPEVLLGRRMGEYADVIDRYSALGCRVLLLAMYDGELDAPLDDSAFPIALVLLNNKIRPEAPETFRFFAQQGVAIKVISGDNALTVSEVARRAGIVGAENYVDARTLTDDRMLLEAAEKYTVFGRVTPDQKQKIVKALKKKKHTVAMTGDGVNDVLALKEADCSVAMASGSEAACQVSNIVLLESNFSVMPSVVMEGRRVINNIERSATLFLVKNIFSMLLAVVSLVFSLPYPFTASQLSLVSSLTIGFPAFILAMEPNENLVRGKFLPNVIGRALPAALTDFVLIIGVLLFYIAFDIAQDMMSTICAVVMGVVGILVIVRICRPFTRIRKLLIGAVSLGFAFSCIFLNDLFTLSPLDFSGMLLLVVFGLLAWPTLELAYRIQERALDWLAVKRKPKKRKRRKS
ncbi:MAG: cation-translocating P-type ATPase [Oscillospiraceae bacterium]